MDSGFYAACAGLRAQSQALEVVAHNLANLNTAGFRGQQATLQSLLALAGPTAPTVLNLAINNFGVLEGSHLDLNVGNLEATGNPLDLGIDGGGFFAIRTAAGMRYTRNGSFHVATNGELVTVAGDQVLGEKGPILVPAGPITVGADGTVSVNGAVANQIRLVEFAPGTKLEAESNTLLRAPGGQKVGTLQKLMTSGRYAVSAEQVAQSMIAELAPNPGQERKLALDPLVTNGIDPALLRVVGKRGSRYSQMNLFDYLK